MNERNSVQMMTVAEEALEQIEGGYRGLSHFHAPELVNRFVSPLDKYALNPQPLPPRVWTSFFMQW